jgi:hypothetical protein
MLSRCMVGAAFCNTKNSTERQQQECSRFMVGGSIEKAGDSFRHLPPNPNRRIKGLPRKQVRTKDGLWSPAPDICLQPKQSQGEATGSGQLSCDLCSGQRSSVHRHPLPVTYPCFKCRVRPLKEQVIPFPSNPPFSLTRRFRILQIIKSHVKRFFLTKNIHLG